MAEIRVEVKKGRRFPAWAWILIALVIIAALVWFMLQRNRNAGQTTGTEHATTGYFITNFPNHTDSFKHGSLHDRSVLC